MLKQISTTAAAAALIVGLALPVLASADTYCVNNGSSCDHDYSLVQLQTALVDAGANPNADTVSIGAGTYLGQFTYNGAGSAPDVISGAGPTTILSYVAVIGFQTNLNVQDGGTVQNLALQIPLAPDAGGTGDTGLLLASGSTASDIQVTGATAENATGVNMSDSTLTGSSIVLNHPSITGTRGVFSSTSGTVTKTSITADTGVDFSNPGAAFDVKRASIRAAIGITTDGGAINLSDSTIDLGGDPSGIGANFSNGNSGTSLMQGTLDGVTIHGTDVNSTGVVSGADLLTETATVGLLNSAIDVAGPAAQVRADDGRTATLIASYDNLNGSPVVIDNDPNNDLTPGTAIYTPTGITSFPSGFTSAATGDFSLLPSSQLVDAGDPADPGPGAVDILGNPRMALGKAGCMPRRDIGAYEFAPAPAIVPVCPGPDVTPPAVVPTATMPKKCKKGFKLKKVKGKKKCVKKKRRR